MYSLLRRRTMMMKPSVTPTERLIYQLNDYTCDGTINTFIDTGIKLFGYEYDSFRIEMEYDGLDLTQAGLPTLLECKSFGSNFNPGLSVRVSNDNQPAHTDAIVTNIYPYITDTYFKNTSSATVILTYNKNSCSINVNGSTVTGSGMIKHNEPLTIGGRYSSHLSNPDRFVQVHISSLKIYATPSDIDPTYINLPLTFKCITGGDLSIKNANTSYDRNFEYSLNGGAWTAFDLPKNTPSKLIATLSPNDTISFRRDNDNFISAQFISDNNLTFDIYGNLLSLQYGSAFNGQIDIRNTGKKAFGNIFSGTNVIDASNLMLTAPIFYNECYQQMFYDCKNLIYAPKILPANTVPQYAYQQMFGGCTSLISAPKIYATTLAGRGSLSGMFLNCTSLVTAPELHITTLGTLESCMDMFKGCTSLITVPELHATTLTQACYQNMFSGCTSLTTAPSLPATTLAESCYRSMFNGCTSLTIAPELPATNLANVCYYEMFKGCTSLTTAPSLSATTLTDNCYQSMFEGCIALTVAPELPATTLTKSCYRAMFSNCTSITAAPELRAQTLVETCYNTMFNGCSSLNYVKCLATDISASNCIYNWVNHVSANGTFVKASGVTWPSGNNGIPNGWTVIEE